ncbi:carboxylating nicotinate-nucleotide diphosphorylase [Alkalihalobacillus sp. 1P02AB]|uniref:carboxylating nicotinate-nucleotide diphosphorylase n=1 Tax=Alkalihalobacillus sp. 1P02AB TaxID=3132260 RepID=UPI0039A6A6A8
MNLVKLKQLLIEFLNEDLGDGDVTSQALPQSLIKTAYITAKQDGVFAGRDIVKVGYQLLSNEIEVKLFVQDGDLVKKGKVIAEMTGPVDLLLAGERVFLNLMQRMSGIATLANKAIEQLDDSTIRLCDTRKTTPGLRMLEKYAVRCGGAFNHRRGLDHAVLLKENHIAAYGGIIAAVREVKAKLGHMTKIEVEITNQNELFEAIEAKVDVIMFDNYTPEQIAKQRKYVPEGIVTEASGGIDLQTLPAFSGCGVDYISLGFLTHSVQAMDLSMLLKGDVKK